jgi:HEAT repeat protein
MRNGKNAITATAAWIAVAFLSALGSRAQDEEPEDPLLQMVVELVSDADRDMRALGLQQVREEAPGEPATKRFMALLPKLSPEARAELVEALGERGDPLARPAILELAAGDQQAVRIAALRALAGLGTDADVALLAKKTTSEEEAERRAATQSLVRLRGDKVNQAIVSTMKEAAPEVRAELLGVLAARNAKEALPAVLANTADDQLSVRLAALESLRFLADEQQAGELVRILKTAREQSEREQAELALLVVCSRGRDKCGEPIIAGLEEADASTRIRLLRALARSGGAAALEAIVAHLNDEDEAVRDQAVRMLSIWPEETAVPRLLEIVTADDSLRHQVLALRGIVRLASPRADRPADLKLLGDAVKLASRPQEKQLVLGVLSGVGSQEALAIVAPLIDDSTLAEPAGLAAVRIAEQIQDGDKDSLRTAMQKVLDHTDNSQTRKRAQQVIDSL